jgi:thymidylate kinase
MIISIRGTHGSGKSTIVKELLNKFDAEPLMVPNEKKPQGYVMKTPWGQLRAVGSYETACGGCDAIQPYDLIWPRIELYAEHGHVIFEGALVSSSYGNIGRASEKYGSDFVFAFLNTPLGVCLERIKKRRAAKGNNKPLDPKNTQVKYDNVARSRIKMEGELGRRCITLDYRKPIPTILGLLKNG